MTRYEVAARLWPLLVLSATHRQVMTYEIAGRLVGIPRQGLGAHLEPIQSYCVLNRLPPLSSLVVSSKTGLPGEGFIASADVPEAQAKAFSYPWMESPPPTVEALKSATESLPTIGRTLEELRGEA